MTTHDDYARDYARAAYDHACLDVLLGGDPDGAGLDYAAMLAREASLPPELKPDGVYPLA